MEGVKFEGRVFRQRDAVVEGDRQLVGAGGQHRQQACRRAQVDALTRGRDVGVEAKAEGTAALVLIQAIGAADAHVLDKQHPVAAVVYASAEGVVGNCTAVEGGIGIGGIEAVVTARPKHIGSRLASPEGFTVRGAKQNAAVGGGGQCHGFWP